MKNSKIAVTGATGMLGSAIVAQLLREGYSDVRLLVRDSARLDRLYRTLDREGVAYSDDTFEVVEVALNNPRELAEALREVETVFHTAAVVSFSDQNAKEIIETNVEITAHVVDAALECGVGLLVHTSSIAALGGMRKGKMYIDETTDLEDMSNTSAYGQSKFLAENEVWRGSVLGLKVIVVNPSVILGVGDWNGGGSAQMVAMLAKGLPFYTKGVMAYVDVRDVARAEVALSECDEAVGERFVLAARNLSFKELMIMVAGLAGVRKPFFCAGRPLTEMAWRADAAISRMLSRQPFLTQVAARSSQERSFYNGEKVRKVIKFNYTPIERTIKEVVDAYVKECRKAK